MDILITVLGATSFGLLVTVHVSVAWTLWQTQARVRALSSLALPPTAFVFALSAGLRFRAFLWLGSLIAYVGLRWFTR